MIKNLVFEGGGVKGIAFIGALNKLKLENKLNNVNKIAGTSAGSSIAALYACGYNSKELKDIVWNTDFNQFKDDSFGIFRDMYRFYNYYGFHKGDLLKDYHENLISEKFKQKNVTFQDLYNKTGNELTITGSCVNTGQLDYFNILTNPNMIVSDAVRISMSIPYYFMPFKFNNKLYIDGGILNNYPVNYYDFEDEYGKKTIINEETLGIQLLTNDEYNNTKDMSIDSITEFSTNTVNLLLNEISKLNKHNDYINRHTVKINTFDISATDFNLTDTQKDSLYQSGIDAVDDYIKK